MPFEGMAARMAAAGTEDEVHPKPIGGSWTPYHLGGQGVGGRRRSGGPAGTGPAPDSILGSRLGTLHGKGGRLEAPASLGHT